MATKIEDIIMQLIYKEEGTRAAIASLDTISDKVKLTTQLLHNLAAQSGATSQQVAAALKTADKEFEVRGLDFIGGANIDAAAQKDYVASLGAELKAKTSLVAGNQQLTASQIAVNHASKAAEIADRKRITSINSYKKAIKDLSKDLGISYEKAAGLLEKTSIGAGAGTTKLNAALKELKAQALDSGKVLEERLVNRGLKKVSKELKAISQLKPPAEQIKAVSQLSIRMEELTGIPAQRWAEEFGQKLGQSRKHLQATSQEIDIMKNGLIGTAKASINLSSVLNTAFGVGMAMLIFGIVQGIQNLVMGFKNAIDASNELRQNLLKLGSAEKIMSEMGGEITPQDMDNLIKKLDEQFVLTPRVDIVSAMRKLAIEVAPLGFGIKEIEELMQVAMLKQIENSDKTLDQIIEPMTTALFGGALKGLQALNFKINDGIIKQEAERLGLWTQLEGQMSSAVRQQTIYAMLVEQTLKKEDALIEAQEKSAFASLRASKQWSNLMENLGSIFAPFWNNFVDRVENALVRWNDGLSKILGYYSAMIPYLLVIGDLSALISSFLLGPMGAATFETLMNKYKDGIGAVFKQYKEDAESLDLATTEDTPTGERQIFPDGMDDDVEVKTDRMKKDIQSLIEWLDNLGDKARKMAEDFAKSFERMQADFNEKVLRFMEDWGIDRERLIEDSNKNLEKKNKQHFDREYWEYLKFQERLRQLREKYLFNLEDALRERDARQVLRLGRQYAMDVNDATIAYDLAKAEREARRKEDEAAASQDLVDKVKRLNEDRALQLERMKEDHALKEARAREDHRIAMDRLDDEIDEKLRKVADAWAEEFGLDRDGAEDIYNELKKFYGQGGLINDLFFYTYENLIGTSKNTYNEIQQYVARYLEQAKILEEARRRIMGYRPQGKDVGGIDWNLSSQSILPGAMKIPTQVITKVEVKKNELLVDMNMSPELEYRIRRSTIQDVNEVLVRFNRSRNRR